MQASILVDVHPTRLVTRARSLPSDDTDYLHEVDYPEVMKRQWFIKGIEQLLELADQDLTAIMCSEENPAECHRHHMIAKYLIAEHPEVKVFHVRGDGNVFRAELSHCIRQ